MVGILFSVVQSSHFYLDRWQHLNLNWDIWSKKSTNVYLLLFEMLQLFTMAVKSDVKLTVVKIRHAI